MRYRRIGWVHLPPTVFRFVVANFLLRQGEPRLSANMPEGAQIDINHFLIYRHEILLRIIIIIIYRVHVYKYTPSKSNWVNRSGERNPWNVSYFATIPHSRPSAPNKIRIPHRELLIYSQEPICYSLSLGVSSRVELALLPRPSPLALHLKALTPNKFSFLHVVLRNLGATLYNVTYQNLIWIICINILRQRYLLIN